jgi:hypothetical protein
MSSRSSQLAVCVIIGVASGLYIWKPLFDNAMDAAQEEKRARNQQGGANAAPKEVQDSTGK